MTTEEQYSSPQALNNLSMRLKHGVWIVLCFSLIALVTFGAYLWFPASLHYHIREVYSISASNQDTNIYFGVLVPTSGPYQQIEALQVSWVGEQIREITPCVDVIKLSQLINAGATQEAVIEYDAKISHGLVIWWAKPDSCQLLPHCLIESDHPLIVKKATQITDGTSWRDSYKIYSFTDKYLIASGEYKDCTGNLSALEAYQAGRGECGEFSRLMVALCRASEIPSIVISGILMPKFSPFATSQTRIDGHPGVAHAWVEFSDDDIWTMADPAWGSSTWDILQFGRNDGRHLSYGCINHEGEVFAHTRQWVDQHGSIVNWEFAAQKYIAAADSSDAKVASTITVTKTWDGRWINALIALVLATCTLCLLRNRLMRKFSIKQ